MLRDSHKREYSNWLGSHFPQLHSLRSSLSTTPKSRHPGYTILWVS